MDNRVTNATREPYEPPTIEDVPLRADEQVLQGCKKAQTPSGGVNTGFSDCISAGCQNSIALS